ncbi:MAG: hypothetical protein ACREP9_05545 [Candidatus Dormibacteraceae bacterium]
MLIAFHEVDVAVLPEKPRVAHKIDICRAKFHLREMNDVGERPMPIAPGAPNVPVGRGLAWTSDASEQQ